MYELEANAHRAAVALNIPEGNIGSGAIIVEDKQCIFTWDAASAATKPPVRIYADTFRLGSAVALRPEFGPAQLFEVVECSLIPADGCGSQV